MRRAALAMQQFETSVKGTSAAIAAVGIGTFVASLVVATRQASKFGLAMAEVSTLLPKEADMARLTKEVIRLSDSFGQDKTNQAKALYQTISAGFTSTAASVQVLTTANELAVAGLTDVATATEGLVSILNAYSQSGLTAAQASDAMFNAVVQGQTTIDELSRSLGLVSPLAAAVGIRFEELTSAISAVTKTGIRTRLAVTGLRQVISSIVRPIDSAEKAAKQLNLAFSAEGLQQAGGLLPFLQEVIKTTGGSREALAQLFGGVEALVPVLALAGDNLAEFERILRTTEAGAGATKDALEKIRGTFSFQFSVLREQIGTEMLRLGEAVTSGLTPVIRAFNENFTTVRAVLKVLKELTLVVLALAGAYKLLGKEVIAANSVSAAFALTQSRLITILKSIPVLLTRIFTGWGLVATAVVAATAAFGIFRFRAIKAAEDAKKAFDDALDRLTFSITGQDIEVKGFEESVARVKVIKRKLLAELSFDRAELERLKQNRAKLFETTAGQGPGLFGRPQDYGKILSQINQDIEKINERIKLRESELEIQKENLTLLQLALRMSEERNREIRIQNDLLDEQGRKLADEELLRRQGELIVVLESLNARFAEIQGLDFDKASAEVDKFRRRFEEFSDILRTVLTDAEIEEIDVKLNLFLDIGRVNQDIDNIKANVQEVIAESDIKPSLEAVDALEDYLAQLERIKQEWRDTPSIIKTVGPAIRELVEQIKNLRVKAIFEESLLDLPELLEVLSIDLELGNVTNVDKVIEEVTQSALIGIQRLNERASNELLSLDPEQIAKIKQKIRDTLNTISQLQIQPISLEIDTQRLDLAEDLAAGRISLRQYEDSLEKLKGTQNSLILGQVELLRSLQATAPELASEIDIIINRLRKFLDLSELTDEKWKDLERQINKIGTSAIQLLNVFGAINDETEAILRDLVQLASSLPGALSGDAASIVSVITSAVSALSGLFGESEESKEHKRIVKANTDALNDLRDGLQDLTFLRSLPGSLLSGAQELARIINSFQFAPLDTGIPQDVVVSFDQFLKIARSLGITLEDIERLADELGLTFEKTTDFMDKFNQAISELTLEQAFRDVTGVLDLFAAKVELFNLDPIQELQGLTDAFLDLSNLPQALIDRIESINLTTAAGRANLEALLQDLFESFPELDFSVLGELTPDEFLDFILNLKRASDSADDFAETINDIASSLTNVPQIFKVNLRRFESQLPELTAPSLAITDRDGNKAGGIQTKQLTYNVEQGAITVVSSEADPRDVAREVLEAFKSLAVQQYGDSSKWSEIN